MEYSAIHQRRIKMDSLETKTALEKISECLAKNENFVLQGGAGSGKTESLKQVLQYVSKKFPKKKVACI